MAAKNGLAKVLSREHAHRIQADEKKRLLVCALILLLYSASSY